MAVKIRLRQQGRANRSFYRIVVTDSRSRRDGKYIEMLGWYNPFEKENKVELNKERLAHWLTVGAEMSTKVEVLAKKNQPELIKELRGKKPKKSKKAA